LPLIMPGIAAAALLVFIVSTGFFITPVILGAPSDMMISNLIDYYVVRRGHYAVAEIFKPDGIYGRWGWRGLAAYIIGFAAMVPFHAIAGAIDTRAGNIVFNWAIPLGLVYWGIKRSSAPEASDPAPVQPVV